VNDELRNEAIACMALVDLRPLGELPVEPLEDLGFDIDPSFERCAVGGLDGGVELHVQGGDRLVPRIVMAAERGGFDLADLSVAEPSLETVFINLTGKELRD